MRVVGEGEWRGERGERDHEGENSRVGEKITGGGVWWFLRWGAGIGWGGNLSFWGVLLICKDYQDEQQEESNKEKMM